MRDFPPELCSQFDKHMRDGTPRALRALRFADTVVGMLLDFLPRNRDYMQLIREHLILGGFGDDAQIIKTPPEWDALTSAQIERAFLETHPAFVPLTVKPLAPSTMCLGNIPCKIDPALAPNAVEIRDDNGRVLSSFKIDPARGTFLYLGPLGAKT